MKRLNRIRQKKIAKNAKGKILDIGYADVPNIYLKGEIIGYDLEKPKKVPNNYTRIIQDDIKNINNHFESNSFDTIIAGEFIEHIDCHMWFFKMCHKLLKKGGYLILSTPTPHYYKTIIGNTLFMRGGLGGNHISVYIPRILNNVAKKVGFKIIFIGAPSKIYIPLLTWQLIYIYKKI